MRGLFLFVVGTLTGLAVHAAIAQSRTPEIVGMNHVGINVPNVAEAVEYYTEVMGFPEAFRLLNDSGELDLVYVQVSQNTFVELRPANEQRPAGITHFGLHVDDMDTVVAQLRERGAEVSDPRLSGAGARSILSNVTDPYGNSIELNELPPDALTRQAMERWQ
jgi:catechol 2,3-dioxygenase-like lactoylglutathione lyase family enzyme